MFFETGLKEKKMKKLVLLGIAFMIVFIALGACTSKDNISPKDTNHALDTSSQIVPNAHYIRIGSGFGPRQPAYTIVSSMNELAQNSSSFNQGAFWETEYTNVIAKYTDNYFTDNFLVIVLLEENSGSNRHKVESVDRDGNIVIQQLIPEIGTSDMATWNIIIELDNSFKLEQFQVVLR